MHAYHDNALRISLPVFHSINQEAVIEAGLKIKFNNLRIQLFLNSVDHQHCRVQADMKQSSPRRNCKKRAKCLSFMSWGSRCPNDAHIIELAFIPELFYLQGSSLPHPCQHANPDQSHLLSSPREIQAFQYL